MLYFCCITGEDMKKAICFALLLCGLASCRMLDVASIDYLEPADITFPPEVRRVGVVNNVVSDSLLEKGGKPSFHEGTAAVCGDGRVLAEELAAGIASANYFDLVVICDSALRQGDRLPREQRLGGSEVRRLSSDLGVDLILSVDRVDLSAERGLAYYPDYPSPVPTLDAKVHALLRLYLPARETSMATLAGTDSLYWAGSWEVDTTMVRDASAYVAQAFLHRLLPVWKEAGRYYYAGGCVEMRDAAVCVKEDDWEGACRLWKNLYEGKSGRFRMYAAYNIAVYHEVGDDLEQAKTWLEKALEIASKDLELDSEGEPVALTPDYRLMASYYAHLESRLSERYKLDIQMERFSE